MNEIHALSGAYAVDALDEAERAQFELHLAGCSVCRDEVASLREAAAVLATLTEAAPSPALRERVLAAAGTVRPLPPVGVPQHREGVVTPLRRRRPRASFLAAAAAAVLIAGGGIAWTQLNDDDQPPSRFDQVLAQGDAQEYSTVLADGSSMSVARSSHLDQAVLEAHAMQAAPSGKQYVVWARSGQSMTAIGVLPRASDFTMTMSADAVGAQGVAVSVEDEGRVPASPSDDIVADIRFSA
jgi:hypothetical protein